MNTIELLGAALGFVGSLSLAAAGVLLAKARRELRSVRRAKADLLSVDTRAEQLEANGLKTVLQPCGRCEGYGVKFCVRCGDCSGGGYRSRVVEQQAESGGFGELVSQHSIAQFQLRQYKEDHKALQEAGVSVVFDTETGERRVRLPEDKDLKHQFESEREARRAAEKRCDELGAHACWCAPPDGFELVSQTVDESGVTRTLTAVQRLVEEEADGFEWKGLRHYLEEVAQGETGQHKEAETAYGFYRYDPGASWDWTATSNYIQTYVDWRNIGNGDAFFLPPETPPMA